MIEDIRFSVSVARSDVSVRNRAGIELTSRKETDFSFVFFLQLSCSFLDELVSRDMS